MPSDQEEKGPSTKIDAASSTQANTVEELPAAETESPPSTSPEKRDGKSLLGDIKLRIISAVPKRSKDGTSSSDEAEPLVQAADSDRKTDETADHQEDAKGNVKIVADKPADSTPQETSTPVALSPRKVFGQMKRRLSDFVSPTKSATQKTPTEEKAEGEQGREHTAETTSPIGESSDKTAASAEQAEDETKTRGKVPKLIYGIRHALSQGFHGDETSGAEKQGDPKHEAGESAHEAPQITVSPSSTEKKPETPTKDGVQGRRLSLNLDGVKRLIFDPISHGRGQAEKVSPSDEPTVKGAQVKDSEQALAPEATEQGATETPETPSRGRSHRFSVVGGIKSLSHQLNIKRPQRSASDPGMEGEQAATNGKGGAIDKKDAVEASNPSAEPEERSPTRDEGNPFARINAVLGRHGSSGGEVTKSEDEQAKNTGAFGRSWLSIKKPVPQAIAGEKFKEEELVKPKEANETETKQSGFEAEFKGTEGVKAGGDA